MGNVVWAKGRPACIDGVHWDYDNNTSTSTSMTRAGWASGPSDYPGPDGYLMIASLISGNPSGTPSGWTQQAQTTVGSYTWTIYSKIAAGDTGATFSYASIGQASVLLLSMPCSDTGSPFDGSPSQTVSPSNPNNVSYGGGPSTDRDVLIVWPADESDAVTLTHTPSTLTDAGFLQVNDAGLNAVNQRAYIRKTLAAADVVHVATTVSFHGEAFATPKSQSCIVKIG